MNQLLELEALSSTRDVSLFMGPNLNIFPELGGVPNVSSIVNLRQSRATVHITHRRRNSHDWRIGWVEFESQPVMIIRNGGERDLFPFTMVIDPALHHRLLGHLHSLLVEEASVGISQPLDGAIATHPSHRTVDDTTLFLPALIHSHYWDELEPPVKPLIQSIDPEVEI